MKHIETLKSLGACHEAVRWASTQPDLETAWDNCNNPEWMLWLDRKVNLFTDSDRRLMACAFVRRTPLGDGRTVWDHLDDERFRNAVEVAERYARGEATDDELHIARSAAGYAAGSAAWYAAMSAASSTARSTARSAAESAAWYAAWSTALSAAQSASQEAALKAQADIIREWGNPFKGNESSRP